MILFSYCIPFLCIFISSAFCLHRICLPLRAPSSGQSSLTRAIFVFAKPKKGNTKRKLEPDDDFDEDIAKNWDLQGLDISLSETAEIENAFESNATGDGSQTNHQSKESSETTIKSTNGSIEKKPKPKTSTQDGIEGSRKQRIENTIRSLVLENQLTIAKISWFSGRLEVTVTDTLLEDSVVSINAEQLQNLHTAIYSELEGYDEAFLVENEGFPVAVSTTEEFKSKTLFEGTLIERNAEHVTISMKGRIVSIPRAIIKEVRMPKPKIVEGDSEMSKLG